MYYDESSRRLNLLSGLVFGTVLGAGLALLFVPGERMEGGRRVVVRAAKSLGRGARAGAGSARARLDAARARRRRAYEGGGDAEDGDHDLDDHDLEDHDLEDQDGGGPATARTRVEGMARRRFTL
ncbi:MAG TPA: hypothetical protein VF541_17685 [Longimicrobium sp.]